ARRRGRLAPAADVVRDRTLAERARPFAGPALVRAGHDEALRLANAGDRDGADAHLSTRQANPVEAAALRALGRAERDLVPGAGGAVAQGHDGVVRQAALRAARGHPVLHLAEALGGVDRTVLPHDDAPRRERAGAAVGVAAVDVPLEAMER